MKLQFLILFVIFSFYLKSQNNELNSASRWHCWDLDGTSQCKDTYNYQLYFSGDTIINGKLYLKLYREGQAYNSLFSTQCTPYNNYYNYFSGLVRYQQNKLYVFNGSDQLYIDYNLQIGDSIKDVLFSPFTPLKITRIDSVNVNGNYLNRFFYQSTTTPDTGYVIEKIGSNHGFISDFTPFFESYKELICYTENNVSVYDTQNTHTSCSIILSTSKNHLHSLQLEIYPNPVTSDVVIETQNNNVIKKLSLKNYLGQLVLEEVGPSANQKYNLSDLNKGIYFAEIETEQGTTVKKIIKQ